MGRQKCKAARTKKTWGNMIQPRKQNAAALIDPKEMDIYELPDKELKIIISEKFR